jgi:2-C-methyl-D-erythritol 2,4-cyclodiphosphate synthase
MRVGIGYDIHRLEDERKLFLGGIEIPYVKGLMGYSDGDVVLHAITDAILGAASLEDIGRHFPDTDPAYKDVASG